MTQEPLIQVQGVSRTFGTRRRRHKALSRVSFAFSAGERLGVVGESGSGKSTLARLIAALDAPDEGDILFQGTSLASLSRAQMRQYRKQVQIVFQDPYGSLDPRMKVGQALHEPLRSLGIECDHGARVHELLDRVGLGVHTESSYPHELSGGQRQRVALARALAPHPRVLVADEAVSALDVSVRAQVLNLISELVDELGLSLIFISHDMGVVEHVSTRVLVLYQGELVEDGAVDAVYQSPQHPYTRELLAAVPRLGGTFGAAPQDDESR